MTKKPPLSFWQIWNMCFGFLGIQFGFALQNANVSRIFQTLGAEVEDLPILWVAAPLTGLIVQPIIGYMSDRTWGRFGRRRPYFTVGAVLASLGIVHHAELADIVDRGRHALDHGCQYQHLDGAVSGIRRRHAARAAAHERIRDAEFLYRHWRCRGVRVAMDDGELVRRQQYGCNR